MSSAAVLRKEPPPLPVLRPQGKVLLVEQDHALLELLAYQMHELGLETLPATSLKEAYRHLADSQLSVVILDLQMPGLLPGGMRELLAALRHHCLILLAPPWMVETARECVRLGAFDFLAKPFAKEELWRTVGHAFRISEVRRRNRRLLERLQHHNRLLGSLGGVAGSLQAASEARERLSRSRQGLARLAVRIGQIPQMPPPSPAPPENAAEQRRDRNPSFHHLRQVCLEKPPPAEPFLASQPPGGEAQGPSPQKEGGPPQPPAREKPGEAPQPRKAEDGPSQASTPATDLYGRAVDYVRRIIGRAEQLSASDIDGGLEIVEEMADQLSRESGLLTQATDRSQPFSVAHHSVNVALIALRTSQLLGFNHRMQSEVGLAALLHELGVVRLPAKLVYSVAVSPREVALMRQRPLYSAELVQQVGPEYESLAQVISQVHERENGSGFPEGLQGHQIRQEAKVVGVADVFEACIHDRPYRKALSGYQTLFELATDPERSFPENVVKALIRAFSLYPPNEYVRLNDGHIAQVEEINPHNLSRPKVRLILDPQGNPLPQPVRLDLSQTRSPYITKALPPSALPARSA